MAKGKIKVEYVCIAVTTILFSLMEVVMKSVSGDFHPLQFTCSRFLAGGIGLIPFAVGAMKKKRAEHPDFSLSGRDLGYFALIGFLGMVLAMSAYQASIGAVPASVTAVLFSSNPIFVTLFAFFILKEKIGKHNIIALVLDVVGILFIINPFKTKLSGVGVTLCIAGTFLFALYGVLAKGKCKKYGGIVVTCFTFLFGSLELLALLMLTNVPGIAAFLEGAGLSQFASIPILKGYALSNLWQVLFVYIGVTGVGFACYFTAMEKTTANTASLVFFFKPMLAPIFAFLILAETIPINMLAGILLILAGALFSILPGFLRARKERRMKAALAKGPEAEEGREKGKGIKRRKKR